MILHTRGPASADVLVNQAQATRQSAQAFWRSTGTGLKRAMLRSIESIKAAREH
jgi:hypothetical protein